jgi:Reverse transcriptase (RNA-dependent DNA polymerase)
MFGDQLINDEAPIGDIEETQSEDADPSPSLPIVPPAQSEQEAPQIRRRCTEIQLLEPMQDLPPKRPRRPTWKVHKGLPELPDDPDSKEITNNFLFALVSHTESSGMYTEPKSVHEARYSGHWDKWEPSIAQEMKSLEDNGTWIDAVLPPGRKAVDSRLVFRLKQNSDGSIERFKSRLVAKGYSQVPGLDFDETYAPVVKLTSIHILLTLALKEGLLHIHQMDVETSFLNGPLHEEIYICLPDGVEGAGKIKRLCQAIYGLKQSPRVWNDLLDKELRTHHYERCHTDYCIYVF